MKAAPLKRFVVVALVVGVVTAADLVAACGDDALGPGTDGGAAADARSDAAVAVDAARPLADAASDPCADAGVPSSSLECAGLYSDFASKTIAPSAIGYAPALSLWSDAAGKERWIALPRGTTIDATNPSEWVFPVGTKLFKQFTYGGRRVETRLFQKVTPTYWVHATYAWNAAETATRVSYGETVTLDSGATWVIPAPEDCDSCHRGRTDRVLGFEQVNLGLAGASGLTLSELVARKLLTPAPSRTNLQIGDGTGLDGPSLGWLHVNCGVTCHNGNEDAQAFGAKMILRLDPAKLDGSRPDPATWDPLKTTRGVPCVTGTLVGQPRIAPGDPASSAIIQLTGQRGEVQMPPLASRVVDVASVAVLSAWIRATDAGAAPDAAVDPGP